MELAYDRLDLNILLDNLKNEVIRKTLAYMVDFKEHDNLVVIPKPHSIEISNADICIAVIVFYGFEKEEHESLKTKNNPHVVSFDRISQTMFEFEHIPIKHIDYMALFFMSLARTEDGTIKEFLNLKNPTAHQPIYHLRNKYVLKDLVWNDELFSLLYKKSEGNSNCQEINKQFTAAMVLKSEAAAFNEENILCINSSFIKEFVGNQKLFSNKEIPSVSTDRKSLFVGFGVVSGKNRAKKAIRLALSSLVFKNQIIEKTKTVLLLISSDRIEMNIDEVGEINDYIKEKVGYNAGIIMTVREDKNLGKSLAVTLMLSEFESRENKS